MSATVTSEQLPASTLEVTVPEAPYAGWTRRVVAYLLDAAIVASVAFLALGATGSPHLLLGVGSSPGPSWTDSGWLVATGVTLALLQAYTGSTPGKRTMGIAVVDETTGRPAGLLTTVLRWLAHVIDMVLFVGFLRPLWHHKRQTFADTLLSTVVLHAPCPAPHPALAAVRARVRARTDGRPDAATGARVVTGAATLLCSVAVAFAVGPTSWSSRSVWDECTVVPGSTAGQPTLLGASLGHEPGTEELTRWGITREQSSETPAAIEVTSRWTTTDPAPGTEVELVVEPADGRPALVRSAVLPIATDDEEGHAYDMSGTGTLPGTTTPDPWTIRVQEPELGALGAGWTWMVNVRTDGDLTATCAGGPVHPR
ncbi:RDD family protein [Oerskovia flava]|uniref:RDD family protein n=1 Tax=Oerskovia flava TaxID=2986422 RepID=UPI002240ABB9|nr:RDD family protein [Oerskovia sp. JB1-3-2]